MGDVKQPLTFTIEPTPVGYQVEASRGAFPASIKRTRTFLGAKFYIWNYKRRMKKLGKS